MGYDVTLHRFTPLSRYDGVSYTTVVVEEASSVSGPWAVIDTQAIVADSNPAEPEPRNISTTKGTLPEGFYRVVWKDAFGGESAPSAAVQRRESGGVRPAVAEVASLLRARTKVTGGRELGTFTEATRPTGDQVEDLISFAEDEVLGKVLAPTESGGAYETRVRGAVALYAAILIETSYFPEQVGAGKSPAGIYEKLYDSRITALIAESKTGEPDGTGMPTSPADPAWIFPPDLPVVGRW